MPTVAYALGTTLAVLACGSCRTTASPEGGAETSCPRFADGLHVTSSAVAGEVIEPLLRWERDYDDARAEYSGHWAEKRWLKVIDGSITEVGYDTDYGDFAGALIGEPQVHRHDRWLCFELAVVRGDGSAFEERWRGEILLP